MKYQRREHRDDAYVNIGFRGRGKLANALDAAAEKAKASSMAAYIKGVVAEAVAKALGVTPASLEYSDRGTVAELDELEQIDAEIKAAKELRDRMAARLGHTKTTRRR